MELEGRKGVETMPRSFGMKSVTNTSSFAPQLAALSSELERGLSVILSLDDLSYCRPSRGGSSVGAQFRHVLDHVKSLLAGLADGRIDYTARERDVRLEIERELAIMVFRRVIDDIATVDRRMLGRSVLVRSEVDAGSWLPSSVGREFEATLSHTIHHHALIAEKLIGMGIECGPQFGVAPSTLAYLQKQAA